ncbi:translocation/assembly module TamB domain-containing protein [Vreelandella lutescens]|uniref:Translocation/assembly module TamB n=1 Tax=Vreelandella lutescens TaxID=1602943 RepID=A0ABQ1NSR7_9GAMM|nr:translocation/assembly module TamB domain-containing protein [Halomonas lutescens]GGC84498.1 translocation/assembly module TamB [Halomonas lutescens]
MTQVEKKTSKNRQKLSGKRRTWLALWSLLRLIIILPLWLFSLVAIVVGVALSPWGTGQLFSQGEQRGFFTYEHQEGALLDSFRLQGFQMVIAGTRIEVSDFELAWAEDCLLSGKLCLDTLRVEGADIHLTEGSQVEEPPQEESGPVNITLPFPVELRDIALNNVAVTLADGTRIRWEAFATSITAEQQQVTIAPTMLESLSLYLPPSDGVLLTQNTATPLEAAGIDAAIQVSQPVVVAVETTLDVNERERLALPDIELPINVALTSFLATDVEVTGAFEYRVDRLRVEAEAHGSDVTLTTLELATPDADARLSANVTLSGDYPLSAALRAELWLPELFPALRGEQVSLDLSGSLADLTANLNVSGPVTASLTAQIDALSPTLPFEARLESERVQWPLDADTEMSASSDGAAASESDEPATQEQDSGVADSTSSDPYVLENLDLVVNGSLEAYQVTLATYAEGPQVPGTTIGLEGEGNLTSFRWSPLTLSIADSALSSEGEVSWAEAISVDTRVRLDDIDPALFVPQLEGNLSGDIVASVRQSGERWDVSLPELDIQGQLQEYPLTLQAALEANSDLEVDIQELLFTQGNNRLTASGQVSQQAMSLEADIALNQLQSLHPDLAGALTGDIQAQGSFAQPEVVMDLNGSSLRFAENRLASLSLSGSVQGLDDPLLNIDLDAQGVNAGGQALASIALDLTGRLSQHALQLSATGEQDNVLSQANVALEGRFNQQAQQYQARLTPLEIDSEAGDIRLEAPLDISYNLANGQARLTPFCLRRLQGGLVCSEEPINASADQGRAVLSIREVPMEMLEPFLPEEWSFEGDTTADLAVSWRQGGAQWQTNLQLLSELAITAVNDYGQPVALPAISLDAQIEANQSQAQADVQLSLSEAGELTLNLAINDPLGQGTLEGQLRANNVTLAPYRPMVVGMDELEGGLNGTVNIGGSTSQPDLQGELALRSLRVSGPDIPVAIVDGELAVTFDGEEGDIDGFVAAERGRLLISGNAYWPADEAWRIGVDLNATQEPLLVVLPQFGRLEAAPDIRIRVTPERLQVRGNVDLPWARLEVGDLPSSATSPSSDEIIITERDDREAERQAQLAAEAGNDPSAADELAATGMALDVLITLTLGRDMQISAYGLESGLGGSLEIRQDSGALQLFGDVNLVNGRFQAFGQDLLIRRGQLIFSGPPGLPVLDFEAIRNPEVTEDEVIAGLRVTGNAEQPNVMIFSEPSMDETRALSYLLRGRAPDASGGGVDSALTTALIGMSLGRTGGAVGSIGEAFGIDDLTLDTTGAGDDSQVAVSGQLTDDLRISYGVGIFSPIAELTLRYTLWRNLYVQAVSGANQAVDLIYRFTRSGKPYIYPQQ